MKPVICSVFVASLLFTAVGWSQAPAFNKTVFMKQGLTMVSQSLDERVKDLLPVDNSCPRGGSEVIENLGRKKGKIFSAVDVAQNLIDAVHPAMQVARGESTRCGVCKQNNVVSGYASVSPEKFSVVAECQGLPPQTFSMDLQDKEELKATTQAILKGQSAEGQRLQRGCPDPCAYYITTAETALDNGKTHLTLNVQCGPPRTQSVFSAVYEFNGGFVHEWSCSK